MKKVQNILIIVASSITLLVTQPTMAMLIAETNFELYNKANKDIRVNLDGDDYIVRSMKPLRQSYYNKRKRISLTIYPDIYSNKNAKKFTINTEAKTVFVSWNPVKAPYLYPQTGRYMGLMPSIGLTQITESGLEFTKETNVIQDEITRG